MKTILPFQKALITIYLSTFLTFSYAQTTTEFVFRNPSLISGVADQDGAVYKFKNVAPGIDANVTVVERSSPEVFLDTIDIPLSNGMGYDKALQPQVGLHGTAPANTDWWMKFKVNFLKAGTNKAAKMDNFVASAIDVDGDNLSIAENITMYKAYGVTTSIASVLTSLLPLTAICPKDHLPGIPVDCATCDGLGYIIKSNGSINNCGKCNNTGKFFALCGHPWAGSDIKITGTSFNALGIDTLAINNMATFTYANTDEVVFSYGAATGAAASSAAQRLNSLWFKSFNYSLAGLLPVRLLDFTANAETNSAVLKWTTTSETDFSHFELEKSTDGIHFNICATIPGNSNGGAIAYYSYKDQSLTKAGTVYYRLRMIDKTGHLSTSDVKMIPVTGGKTNTVLSAYPNPAKDQLNITLPVQWNGKKAVASLFNTAGILVAAIQLNTLNSTQSLDVSRFAAGLYTLSIICMDQNIQTRFVKN